MTRKQALAAAPPALVALAVAALAAYVAVVLHALHGNAFFAPYDGTFQNYNPLHRIALGQIPIRDFDDFMGIGTTWFEWLFFRPFGVDYVASREGAALAHIAAFLITGFVAGRLAGLRPSVAFAFSVGLIAFAVKALPGTVGLLLQAHETSNGVRDLLPAVAASVLYLGHRRGWLAAERRLRLREALVFGGIAGAGIAWSPDYGVPAAAAVLALWLVCHGDPARPGRTLVFSFVAAANGAAALLLTLAIAGQGSVAPFFAHAREIARWNLGFHVIDARSTFLDLHGLAWHGAAILALSGFSALLARRMRRRQASIGERAFFVLAAAEALAALLKAADYFLTARSAAPMYRLLPFVVILGIAIALQRKPKTPAMLNTVVGLIGVELAALLLLFALFGAPSGLVGGYDEGAQWKAEPFVAELGGALSPGETDLVAAGRRLNAEGIRRFVMTYRTALAYVAGAESPTRDDYLIHAEGPQAQARFVADFLTDDAPVAVTMNHENMGYDAWLERKSWSFYRALMLRYAPAESVSYAWIWRKRATPLKADGRDVPCTVRNVAPRAAEITFDATALPAGPWYVETRPAFDFPGWGHKFIDVDESDTALDTMITRNLTPVWPWDAERTEQALPAMLAGGRKTTVRYLAYGGDEDAFRMTGCKATAFLPAADVRMPDSSFPARIHLDSLKLGQGRWGVEARVPDAAVLNEVRIGSRLLVGGANLEIIGMEYDRLMLDVSRLADLPETVRQARAGDVIVQKRPMADSWNYLRRAGRVWGGWADMDAAFHKAGGAP